MRSVEHDDFDLDFSDDDFVDPIDLDDTQDVLVIETVGSVLRYVQRGSHDFVGHLLTDSKGQIWMINPHEVVPSRKYGLELISRDSFQLDEDEDCGFVAEPDAFIRSYSEYNLTMATINGLPLLLPCVEH